MYRVLGALGMGGEWSLGVALVMEIWPSKSRPMLASLIGAASNVGFLLIALVGLSIAQLIGPENSSWRLLMFIGATPALLTFFVRIFVPESERIRRELRKRMRFARHCEEDSLKYAKRAAECEARGRHAKKDSDKRKYLRRHDIAEGKRKASDLAMARAYAIAVGMGRGAVPGIPELAPPPEYVFY